MPFRPSTTSPRSSTGSTRACAEAGRDPADAGPLGGPDDRASGATTPRSRGGPTALGRKVDELNGSTSPAPRRRSSTSSGTWQERTGLSRFYLQMLDLADLDHLELIAAEVAPQLA